MDKIDLEELKLKWQSLLSRLEVQFEIEPDLQAVLFLIGVQELGQGSKTNYVRVVSDFTQEYDKIQYELILLKTSIEKGNQYVGDAIYTTLKNLSWSQGNKSTKVIYLIGNGMINTSKFINNKKLAEEATAANITINAFYTYYGSKKIPKEILGWRHWELKQKLPSLTLKEQDLLLRQSVIRYFEESGVIY